MSTTSTTTTNPGYLYPFGVTRKAGISTPSEKVSVVLPTASGTSMNPYALKTYVDFDNFTGIFDGAGVNKVDDGANLFDFSSLAPAAEPSFSTSTSTTTTTTTSTTTTTTTV